MKKPCNENSDDLLNDLIGLGKKSIQKSYFPQLQAKNKELIESEERYKLLANNIHDVICLVDLNLEIMYITPSVKKKHGYTPEELLGQKLSNIIFYEDFVKMMEILKIALDIKDQENNEEIFELRLINKDKTLSWLETAVSIIYKDDQPIHMLGVSRNIDDRKRAESERKKMQNQLIQSQKMDAIGVLAGGLAHDLNNVLSGIVAPISIIMEEGEAIQPDKMGKYLSVIQQSGTRATNIVAQLLTLSRKQEIHFKKIDLNQSLKNVIEIAENSFDKSVELAPEYFSEPVLINGDPTQIEQILLNLLVNAEHSMTIMKPTDHEWGGKISCSFDSFYADSSFCRINQIAQEGEYWKISVRDTGVGIDDGQLNKIFDPFYSTKDKGKGTGLGLSMVYNIVIQHKGFINIYSEKNRGSIFHIFLPMPLEPILEISKKNESPQVYQGDGGVLIIDDEPMLRLVANDMLNLAGYKTFVAQDGREGVKLFKENQSKIDLILLDMVMPKINGKETYLELKKINPRIRAILTSGFKQDKRIEATLQLGANGFLQKPYTIYELTELAYKVLNRSNHPQNQ